MLPTYVISLPDAYERRATMRSRLDALGIAFEFFDAVDGRKPLGEKPYGVLLDRSSLLPETQFACALSHLQLAKRIEAGASDMALVLEDDALLSDELPTLVTGASGVPFDILKLEGQATQNRPFLSRGAIGHHALRVYNYVSWRTAGYILTRKAARHLLATILVIDDSIDHLMSKSRLDIVELYPYAIWQDVSPSQQGPQLHQRSNFLSRQLQSFRRRARIIALYGWRASLALDMQKIFHSH